MNAVSRRENRNIILSVCPIRRGVEMKK